MKKYIHYQSIVQFRVSIDENGNVGMPEPVKAFSKVLGEEKPKKRSQPKTLEATKQEEELL
jgi:hypothetical protein